MPNVSFTRGGSTGIDSTPLKNGQILFDKGANRILLDVVIDNVLTRLTIKDGIFDGTTQEWDALTDEQKSVFKYVNFLDDYSGGGGGGGSPQSLGFGYGTCTTAEATTAKVVTLSGYTLVTNGYVSVKFTNAVPANATMNINSKGAKAIYYHGSAITAGVINAGDLATFIYNGSQYHLVGIDNLASINGVKLVGNKTSNDLGLMNKPTYLTQTLAAGSTTVTFTDSAISNNSLIAVYTSIAGLNYSSIVSNVGSIVITYPVQSVNISVTLEMKNI